MKGCESVWKGQTEDISSSEWKNDFLRVTIIFYLFNFPFSSFLPQEYSDYLYSFPHLVFFPWAQNLPHSVTINTLSPWCLSLYVTAWLSFNLSSTSCGLPLLFLFWRTYLHLPLPQSVWTHRSLRNETNSQKLTFKQWYKHIQCVRQHTYVRCMFLSRHLLKKSWEEYHFIV